METLISADFIESTADIEKRAFAGDRQLNEFAVLQIPNSEPQLPSGDYRVIDGQLFQVYSEPAPSALGHQSR